MPDQSLWGRLRRRKIVQWALAYLAGAFVVFQILDAVSGPLLIPTPIQQAVITIVVVGFFVTLVLAWYHGEKGNQRVTGPELLMVAALFVLAGTVVFSLSDGEGPSAAQDAVVEGDQRLVDSRFLASVAVLPFENLGPQEEELLGHGIAEEINAQLTQVPALKVISRTSVVALEGIALTTPQIADTLGVSHLLEGTLQTRGDSIVVTAQLIEASTDAHIWADTYRRTLDGFFGLRDEIARHVTAALIESVPDLRSPGLHSRTGEADAYEAYLRGTYALKTRTREGILAAISAFEDALAIDPGFAGAYARLASAHGLWVSYGYPGGLEHYRAAARSIAYSNLAIALDPDAAEAYASRAYVMTKAGAPADVVHQDFERAIELQPNVAEVHGWLSHLLVRERRFEEALPEAATAIELDPLAPGRRTGFAIDALAARRYEDAISEAEVALSLEPDLSWPREIIGQALLLLGRAEDCVEQDLRTHPAIWAMCLREVGRVDEAEAVIDSTAALAQSGGSTEVSRLALLRDLTAYAAWTGRTDEAIRWLELVFRASPFGLDYRVMLSGIFDRAMDDSEFRRLLEESQDEAWDRVFRASLTEAHGPS